MADTTTIGTDGRFGTVTDRIVALATGGRFLEIDTTVSIDVVGLSGRQPSVAVTGRQPAVSFAGKA